MNQRLRRLSVEQRDKTLKPQQGHNREVRRNLAKIPTDFMFQLTVDEWDSLRPQFATFSTTPSVSGGRGQHRKHLPYVFTEHGAIMAANLLSSPRALEVSVYVVRAFVRLHELMTPPEPPKRPIGFVIQERKIL